MPIYSDPGNSERQSTAVRNQSEKSKIKCTKFLIIISHIRFGETSCRRYWDIAITEIIEAELSNDICWERYIQTWSSLICVKVLLKSKFDEIPSSIYRNIAIKEILKNTVYERYLLTDIHSNLTITFFLYQELTEYEVL